MRSFNISSTANITDSFYNTKTYATIYLPNQDSIDMLSLSTTKTFNFVVK